MFFSRLGLPEEKTTNGTLCWLHPFIVFLMEKFQICLAPKNRFFFCFEVGRLSFLCTFHCFYELDMSYSLEV